MSKEKSKEDSEWRSPKSDSKKQFFKGKKSVSGSDKKSFGSNKGFSNSEKKPFKKGDSKPFGSKEKPFDKGRNFDRSERKPYGKEDSRPFGSKGKPFDKDKGGSFNEKRSFGRSENKPFSTKQEPSSGKNLRPRNKANSENKKRGFASGFGGNVNPDQKPVSFNEKDLREKLPEKIKKKFKPDSNADIRLNKYIANAGICSRREADVLIESGQITVNGNTITEMGYKVLGSDSVKYGNKLLNREKLVYVLLNKPKDFLTTTDDPEDRRTVMDLVAGAAKERIYPVGRLDRMTTGLLLLTNDGELAEKLSKPSNEIRKIYEVHLDKTLIKEDFDKILEGLILEDGEIKADHLAVISPDATKIGIEIHSGKNRIIRRLFESLGYDVIKLDRTTFASLTKKDLSRGKWRYLAEKEIIRLKYLI